MSIYDSISPLCPDISFILSGSGEWNQKHMRSKYSILLYLSHLFPAKIRKVTKRKKKKRKTFFIISLLLYKTVNTYIYLGVWMGADVQWVAIAPAIKPRSLIRTVRWLVLEIDFSHFPRLLSPCWHDKMCAKICQRRSITERIAGSCKWTYGSF